MTTLDISSPNPATSETLASSEETSRETPRHRGGDGGQGDTSNTSKSDKGI